MNALNVYEVNLINKLFSPDLSTSNSNNKQKYVTENSRNNSKDPKRGTNYDKYYINARDTIMWNQFLSETEKKILSQQLFKRKIKENTLEFAKELNFV